MGWLPSDFDSRQSEEGAPARQGMPASVKYRYRNHRANSCWWWWWCEQACSFQPLEKQRESAIGILFIYSTVTAGAVEVYKAPASLPALVLSFCGSISLSPFPLPLSELHIPTVAASEAAKSEIFYPTPAPS